MFGHNEETTDDGEQDECLLHPSAYYVMARLSLLVHGCFLIERRSPAFVR